MKSPAQIGPDLSTAVEDVQTRFGRTVDDFLREPTGTMSVVLSRQIILTPEQKADGDREAARGVREHQRQKTDAEKASPAPAHSRLPRHAIRAAQVRREP